MEHKNINMDFTSLYPTMMVGYSDVDGLMKILNRRKKLNKILNNITNENII